MEQANSNWNKRCGDTQATVDNGLVSALASQLTLDDLQAKNSPKNDSKNEKPETDDQRRVREEQETSEKNQLSLIRMLRRHNQLIDVSNNMNIKRNQPVSDTVNHDCFSRDELTRTASMVSRGYGTKQMMSRRYKLVTSSVLWFCYFALALNDYIFGPTFNDLSAIMSVPFEKITYFAIIRQCAYTMGSVGGIAFDYVNRQVSLTMLLFLSAVTLFLTPYVPSIGLFYIIAILNGFSAGACDVGFHVWILEMFQNGGGPLLQALHFSFGVGIAIAPLISANFLSDGSSCTTEEAHFSLSNLTELRVADMITIEETRHNLMIPFSITGAIVLLGGLMLLSMFWYKKYIPPKERQLPVSFDEQMPTQLTRMEKLELWRKSVPSFYIILIITFGSLLICVYYGIEVTYFQFVAQYSTATPLPIHGKDSANLEAATGTAYAIGGLIATLVSFRVKPQHMVYVNFFLMNVGSIILQYFAVCEYDYCLKLFWVANIIIGFGFSSCYATVYTFMEHQINVTNTIGSVFLFAGGMGTAVLPIFFRNICSNPQIFVYVCIFSANIALLLFIVMHVMTTIRYKQVKLIKTELMKDPAKLTHFKERSLSTLSYEPQ